MDKYFVGYIGGEFNWERVDTTPTNAETSMVVKSGDFTAKIYFEKAEDKVEFMNLLTSYMNAKNKQIGVVY